MRAKRPRRLKLKTERQDGRAPMTIRDDPEGTEIKTLLKHVSLGGKEVLEVGCGEGRLT